jgi:hypothetical protein
MKSLPEMLIPSDRISTLAELYQAVDLLSTPGTTKIDEKLPSAEGIDDSLFAQSANLWIDLTRTERRPEDTETLAGIFVRKRELTN